MRKIAFETYAFQDITEWATSDKKRYRRIIHLITDILRHPYSGIGKPEPLKYELNGYWSRRIDNEHRLVYKVEEESIIISCKYHYE